MNNLEIIEKLKNSKFRSSFKLKENDILYIKNKGIDTIESHTYDFIVKRLKPYPTKKDGKQTPMRGHPVFIAQHATATCCRSCLYKWHNIPKDKELNLDEVNYIKTIIMLWIKNNIKND